MADHANADTAFPEHVLREDHGCLTEEGLYRDIFCRAGAVSDTGADIAARGSPYAFATADAGTNPRSADALARSGPAESRRHDSAVRGGNAVAVTERDTELAAPSAARDARTAYKHFTRPGAFGCGNAGAECAADAKALSKSSHTPNVSPLG